MLLRKTPLSKKLTSDEIENKLKDVVSQPAIIHALKENLTLKCASVFVFFSY